jgi:cell surface protein SprA
MSNSVFLNKQVQQNYTQAFDARVTIEPYSDWEIILNAAKSYTENRSLYFRDSVLDVESEIRHQLPREIGSFTISYFAMNTIFNNDINGLFQKFEDNRPIISQRIGQSPLPHELDGPDYKQGYGRAQQDVLIPAFLAAYTNKDANTVKVANDYTQVLFKEMPRVNWEVKYEGLAKLPKFSSIFSRFAISHGYQSTLTVNSFNTSNSYEDVDLTRKQDLNSSYYSRFEIPAIVITEQFVPLLGIRMELRSGLSMDLEFKKSRLLSMSFITYQLSETKTSEYVIGFGYRMKNVVIGFLQFKNQKKKKKSRNKKEPVGTNAEEGSDLNIAFDFSLRDDITINHLLDQSVAEPTRGLRQIQISPSIDYNITKQLNLRLFFDFSRTNPKTSASFPITTSRGGVTITFSLN